MPVPFEALLPYGIMMTMFAVTGVGLGAIKLWDNGGKRPRYNLDQWDRQMMKRDYRLTGAYRAQSDDPKAPVGFEVNSQWPMETRTS